MKKGIVLVGLLAGSSLLLTAYGRDNVDRERQNVVAAEDCTQDEVGTGYMNEGRKGNQSANSQTGERQRQNLAANENGAEEHSNEGNRNSKGRGMNRA